MGAFNVIGVSNTTEKMQELLDTSRSIDIDVHILRRWASVLFQMSITTLLPKIFDILLDWLQSGLHLCL